jgi:N-methylhydantoinase B
VPTVGFDSESRQVDPKEVDAVKLVVMANRMDGITREMTNTLLRTGRSSVLALARDFSCSITTANHELISAAEGCPAHVFGSGMLSEDMAELHPDFAEGDAFLHNDPYRGNSHAADHTIVIPVFWEGEHMFTACAKAHQADTGNALPTTYMPTARDVYEEGALIFPCVRVQQNGEDVPDIIRMCERRIRVPHVWYGDYLAMVAAARIAEQRLKEFCAKFGGDTVKHFCSDWLDYSERRAIEAIKRLPSGRINVKTHLDPVAGLDEGLDLQASIDVDAEHARVVVDLRDNADCTPTGLNLTESTATNSGITAILLSLNSKRDATAPIVPNNAGSFRRIKVLLRENCVVGIPRHPASCSMATTTITDRVVGMLGVGLAGVGEGLGMADPSWGLPAYAAVVSGNDPATREPYVTQLFCGTQGGPATSESDGWLCFLNTGAAGLIYVDSCEVDEQKYPMVIWRSEIWPDSEGPGQRRGAPGNICVYGPIRGEMTVVLPSMDGYTTNPVGVRGGGEARGPQSFVQQADGKVHEMTTVAEFQAPIELSEGECIGSRSAGGGGYGDPLEREVELVLADVREGYVSAARAAEMYGVVLSGDPQRFESLSVDMPATLQLRVERAKPAST